MVTDKLTDGQPADWWDGTFNGTPMQGGLYKWKSDWLCLKTVRCGKTGVIRAGVLLIR